MTFTTRWVHGTVAEAEGKIDHVTRKGWGTQFGFRTPTENWFHFPLPTLATLDEQHLVITRVFVLYTVDRGVLLKSVHVYDGPRVIMQFDELNYQGEHDRGLDRYNQWGFESPRKIDFGIGISVRVDLDPNSQVAAGDVFFNAAGAEFYND
jgi:hypothetical protein